MVSREPETPQSWALKSMMTERKKFSQNANWWLVSRVEVKEKAPDEIQNDSKRKKTKVCTFVSISSGHYLSNTLPCIYR